MPVSSAVIEPRPRDLGGFEVRRVLPAAGRQMVGPFIFFDHLGPGRICAGPRHRCPAASAHRPCDCYLPLRGRARAPGQPRIRPADPPRRRQLDDCRPGHRALRAHGDELRRSGSRIHGIQTWVALPRSAEETEPAFFHHPAATLPRSPNRGCDCAGDCRYGTGPTLARRGVLGDVVRRFAELSARRRASRYRWSTRTERRSMSRRDESLSMAPSSHLDA